MDAFAGAIGVSDSDGKSTPVYSACVPRQQNSVNPYFYAYLLRHMAHSGFITTLAKGIRERSTNFSFTDFAGLHLPLPAKHEQDRIVDFLDEKTAEIDRLIAKKQRQIELLDEQKAILITRAVTRGLHPHAELQDSGIPWIGPIPKHWRVVPIKRMASVQNGVTLGPVYPVNMSSEVPYLRVANVQNGSLNLNTVATLRLPRRIASKYLLQSGDVLVAEGGDLDKLGRGCVWRAEIPYCIHQNHVFAVRTEAAKLLPEFLSTALGSRYGQRYFMLTGKQTTNLASTNSTSLMNFPLATPSLEEQKQIMEELARTLTAFERARNAITSQIQTLQTLRSTLIAHAVTGKIHITAVPGMCSSIKATANHPESSRV
jgi:type I restriction enzyme S subunit